MEIDLLMPAVQAACAAGREILKIYETDFGVAQKADDSPLTIADTLSHQTILARLETLGLPLMSEEGREIAFEERRQWARYWLVDPLDGTKEFVKRNGEFTVNIALIENQRPVLGVIYIPVQDTLYFAETRTGAFKIERLESVGRQIDREALSAADLIAMARRLPLASDPEGVYTVAGSRSHGSAALNEHLTRLKAEHGDIAFISAGSSLKFCLVAEGRADQYPRLGPTMEWDTAAGQVIAECAGARVLEYTRGEPLQYNKADLINPWFIVK
jgi:3'(2'), 5'-bisphosphate nucleotidase